jgi:hypothetical protein
VSGNARGPPLRNLVSDLKQTSMDGNEPEAEITRLNEGKGSVVKPFGVRLALACWCDCDDAILRLSTLCMVHFGTLESNCQQKVSERRMAGSCEITMACQLRELLRVPSIR